MYYSAVTLSSSNLFDTDAAVWISAACPAAQLIGIAISLATIDTHGRRAVALRSAAATTLCLILLAISFSLENSVSGRQPLLIVSLVLYLVSYGAGLSGVPWLLTSELFPQRVRPTGVAQACFVNWMLNFLVSESFLRLSSATRGGVFGIYAALTAAGGAALYRYMPETRNLRLEEVEEVLARGDAGPKLKTEASALLTGSAP